MLSAAMRPVPRAPVPSGASHDPPSPRYARLRRASPPLWAHLCAEAPEARRRMIVSRTPFRISLFGGGSDYPTWYRENGGSVLGMAIDKYCRISVRHLPPFFEHRHRIVYSRIELVNEIETIEHPAVRAILREMSVRDGIEIHHDGDLPARSGLGSSSSFTVGLLNALNALKGRHVTRYELAQEAIRIE